jgi:hypothetical protein
LDTKTTFNVQQLAGVVSNLFEIGLQLEGGLADEKIDDPEQVARVSVHAPCKYQDI